MPDKPIKRWRAAGPSGTMETMARTKAKAESNLRFRLIKDCGMTRWQAHEYDFSDLKEI